MSERPREREQQEPGPGQPDPYATGYPYGWTGRSSGPGQSPHAQQPPLPTAPAFGYGSPPREHPSGITVLVLGILSLVVCPLTGVFAISIGGRALREIDANPTAYTNRQTIAVGRILGIVGLAVVGGFLALYLLFAVALVGAISLSPR